MRIDEYEITHSRLHTCIYVSVITKLVKQIE